MNLDMIMSRDTRAFEVWKAEFEKLTVRVTEILPTLAERREEILKEQERYLEDEAGGYFLTTDWEIDLGVFLDTGNTPSHYSELEFYARILFYSQIMQGVIRKRLLELEERLVSAADYFFFHVKDLAEQGNEEAKKVYEELKILRQGLDKPLD